MMLFSAYKKKHFHKIILFATVLEICSNEATVVPKTLSNFQEANMLYGALQWGSEQALGKYGPRANLIPGNKNWCFKKKHLGSLVSGISTLIYTT